MVIIKRTIKRAPESKFKKDIFEVEKRINKLNLSDEELDGLDDIETTEIDIEDKINEENIKVSFFTLTFEKDIKYILAITHNLSHMSIEIVEPYK